MENINKILEKQDSILKDIFKITRKDTPSRNITTGWIDNILELSPPKEDTLTLFELLDLTISNNKTNVYLAEDSNTILIEFKNN